MNPVTGTGTLTVPLPLSPGRGGFGPPLTLSYDSGAGNGPFGFGWTLGIPAITRRTDRGLPQYRDAEESDVFLLAGAEDLVPLLLPNGQRHEDKVTAPGFTIHRYRPRIEGLFARIERWTENATGHAYWRTISRDNVTTTYGRDAKSCVSDPADPDPDHPSRVFSWLACESWDDKGNALVYTYAAEDAAQVDAGQANERNRVRTANRHLKRVQYGNRVSHLIEPDLSKAEWLFELVFDYGEGHLELLPLDPNLPQTEQHRFVRAAAKAAHSWEMRPDPFSSYRAGFEVRTQRRCRRVLMFHRFAELGPEPCLVRALDFDYADFDYGAPFTIEAELAHPGSTRIASFIRSITQTGYLRDETKPVVEIDGVRYVTCLQRALPPLELEYSKAAIEDAVHEVDPASAENLPIGVDGTSYLFVDLNGEGIPGILTEQGDAWFYKPNLGEGRFGPIQKVAPLPSTVSLRAGQQLLDLAGDGQIDLVAFGGPAPGFYERTEDEGWNSYRPFASLPNVEWTDANLRFVDLDGDGHADALVTEDDVFTWYPSLAEEGFGAGRQVRTPGDEERGARIVFADGTQSIHLADMSGDGLADLVRVRNGEVCYWPNLGYGRFGPKVTMDGAPRLEEPDQFDHRRVRLADIDGSGTNDLIYHGHDGVRLSFNQSGNRWSQVRRLNVLPHADDSTFLQTADLFGNGTACLVWSSRLAGDERHPLRYVDLMGGTKPHLLLAASNNLGAETHVRYASSTKFYLADRLAGRPWLTRLPFPVQVVERTETYDRIGRNRFVTRYAYHHGYFDGEEREFRGFGLVDQYDTEEFATLSESEAFPSAENIDAASHVPPVLTRTWYHTGAVVARDFTRDFYREPGLSDADAQRFLLDDTVLPSGLSMEEEREACRALKGLTLRSEVYAVDGTAAEPHPYTVSEQNHTVRRLQPKGTNRHAVFLAHAQESLAYHYERLQPPDPRVAHALTLDVDDFGNVRKSASVTYGRRTPDGTLPAQADRDEQAQMHVTYSESEVTNAVDLADDYRPPQPSESSMYEITGLALPAGQLRFTMDQIAAAAAGAAPLDYEENPTIGVQKRLLEHTRTLYRRNDLDGALDLNVLESRALPFDRYKLAFTPGLVTQVYAGKATNAMLETEGRYVHTRDALGALDDRWWIPSGRLFFSPDSAHTAAQELAWAREHFFLPYRMRDPFHTNAVSTESRVTYDGYHLLVADTVDALGNQVAALDHDYRLLQPRTVRDPNGNRATAAFDALGMVAGTAVMGKAAPAPVEGDSLAGFTADLTDAQIAAHLADPFAGAAALLQSATTRIVSDPFAYYRTRNAPNPQPAFHSALARETHAGVPPPVGGLRIRIGFSYSDGFGREIQTKAQAEPANGMDPRWIGSGWTIFNNKGKPVRAYEPFFTATHQFELAVLVGVSPITFYDPAGRVAGVLHPDHTWQKTVFTPWRQETWDASDTLLVADPKTDADVGRFFARLPDADYLPTWHAQRDGGALGADEQAAARKAAVHAATPAIAHSDSLARTFLAIVHNRFQYTNTPPLDPPVEEHYLRRVGYDIQGNEREVHDANGRLAMTYAYDMLKHRIRGTSMEAGDRWSLSDVAGKVIRSWDSLGHATRSEYDPLRRALRTFVAGTDPGDPNAERLTDRVVHGEQHPDAESLNLRGGIFLRLDQAGVARNEAHDFKGNLLRSSRRIAVEFAQTIDWSAIDAALPADATTLVNLAALDAAIAPLVENETYTNQTSYDALNRPATQTAPDGTVFRLAYDLAGQLETVDANLRGIQQNGAPVWTPFVTDLDYDAKGQRTLIAYGNAVETTYDYDPLTFRLRRLHTTGAAGNLQDLSYTWDPSGNVTRIGDAAQQTIFFRNHRIDPSAACTYDALYRLIEATGREHLGMVGGTPIPHSPTDAPRVGIAWADNDGDAMGAYLERYLYDPTGNILEMEHRGTDPVVPGWTRTYQYAEPNNRLTSTTVGANPAEQYIYDAHGNVTRMPHLGGVHPAPNMFWDYRNQLSGLDLGGGGTVHFVYDSGGQRTRKVWQKAPGLREERIYLGPFEIFRRRDGGGNVTLERETLHVMDDTRRIAIVETRTVDVAGTDPAPEQLIRYQLANHLGTATLELDGAQQIISYEEYTPYGSTAYQAVRSQTDTPKRYRYCGVERDEESGLGYHTARYYAPWLGRWTATDPAGLVDGDNLYRYSRGNPIRFHDPGGTEPPPEKPSLSAGDFPIRFTNPLTDPITGAYWGDLIIPGLLGAGLNKWDFGGRYTSTPGGRKAANITEFIATGLLFYGPMVLTHEIIGHIGVGARYGSKITFEEFYWFTALTSAPSPALGARESLTKSGGGVNQQNLNADATYARASVFGRYTVQDSIWYLLGRGGIWGYGLLGIGSEALGRPIGSNDIRQYNRTFWSPGAVFASGFITAIPSFLAAGYALGRFAGHNERSFEVPSVRIGTARLTFPDFETLLTPSGPVIGGSTVLGFRGGAAIKFGVDVRPVSDFAASISARVYNWRVAPGLQINPYARFTAASDPGIYGGLELGVDLARPITITGAIEGGREDIRAEVEGLPAEHGKGWGVTGHLGAIYRW